jgi:hypothetical protein
MKQLHIGTVIISYDEQGKVTTTSFTPSIKINSEKELLDQLSTLKDSNEDQKILQDNANLIFGAWFNKLTNIELEDQTKFQIVSRVENCSRYANNKIRSCTMSYTFEEVAA